jgi:hypothetical protein
MVAISLPTCKKRVTDFKLGHDSKLLARPLSKTRPQWNSSCLSVHRLGYDLAMSVLLWKQDRFNTKRSP